MPKVRRAKSFWLGVAICGSIGMVTPLVHFLFMGAGPMRRWESNFLMALSFLLPPIGALLANQVFLRAAIPHVRAEVGGLCTNCGYDIRATPEQCPECGTSTPAAVHAP